MMRTIMVWLGAVVLTGGLWSASVLRPALAEEPAKPSSSSKAPKGAAGKEVGGSDRGPPVVEGEPATPAEAGEVQARRVTITLGQPVHFTGSDGTAVQAEAGTYTVDLQEGSRLQLRAEGRNPLRLDAQTTTHTETIETPLAITVPGEDPDVLHIVLLLPDGKALDAPGSLSGTRPRAITKLATTSQIQTAVVAIPHVVPVPSVVLYEHPNFGGRSQALGVGDHRFYGGGISMI